MIDQGESVLAKLRNKARLTGKNFQLLIQLFCQEEFLRKIAHSKYKDNLILKGGLFLYCISGFEGRPTMDIDLMVRNLSNKLQDIEEVTNQIISQNTGNDFIVFKIKSVKTIAPQRDYHGARVKIIAQIKNTKTPFDVDMGIGDVIIPKAEIRILPTQLPNFEEPVVMTYSLESTIAEKFDAIISRMELSSNKGMQMKWKHFIEGTLKIEIEFIDVIETISSFISPIFDAIVNENELIGIWNPSLLKYESEACT